MNRTQAERDTERKKNKQLGCFYRQHERKREKKLHEMEAEETSKQGQTTR